MFDLEGASLGTEDLLVKAQESSLDVEILENLDKQDEEISRWEKASVCKWYGGYL